MDDEREEDPVERVHGDHGVDGAGEHPPLAVEDVEQKTVCEGSEDADDRITIPGSPACQVVHRLLHSEDQSIGIACEILCTKEPLLNPNNIS